MNKQEIIEEINKFLIDEIEIDESVIKPEANLYNDLGIDSLDFVDIVVIVEKIFGFKIRGDEMKDIITLNQFYDYVNEKVTGNMSS